MGSKFSIGMGPHLEHAPAAAVKLMAAECDRMGNSSFAQVI